MNKRLRFFRNHLILSILVSLIMITWVMLVWYPSPLDRAVGVTKIFWLMICVDVILGPVLCFIVYKENKKSLKFDLGFIISVQIIAFIYGVFNIEQGRPAWLVFSVDRFELIRKNEIYGKNIKQARPEYQQVSWFKPQYVAMTFSQNRNEKSQNMMDEVFGGISIAQRPERYTSLDSVKKAIQVRSQDLKALRLFNDANRVVQVVNQYPSANAWLPLKANAVDMVVLINKEKAEVVKIVDLRPWK